MAMRHSCTSSGSIEVMVLGSSVTVTIRSVFSSKTCGGRAMVLPIEPYRDGAAMRGEPLRLRQGDGRRRQLGQRARVAAEQRRAIHEIEDTEARGVAGRARGR